jgi:hypothetical protein
MRTASFQLGLSTSLDELFRITTKLGTLYQRIKKKYYLVNASSGGLVNF